MAANLLSRVRSGVFVKLFGSSVAMQALLSASNFIVGLVLIRRATDLQYGYYVLVTNALSLVAALQGAFIGPHLVTSMPKLDRDGRRGLIGALVRQQAQIVPIILVTALVIAGGLWFGGLLDESIMLLMCASLLAAIGTLRREFFRMVLFNYQRPQSILKADAVYVMLLIGGVYAAIMFERPALIAVLTLGLAAWVGALLLARSVKRDDPWDIHGVPDIWQQVARLGRWSIIGAVIHWALSQGYSYIVASKLDVQTVAAVAATRLLLMPVNLLSTGIGTLLLPMTSHWVHAVGSTRARNRLLLVTAGLCASALCYFAVMWLTRDWIFMEILKKEISGRDHLLILWCFVFLLMLIRDQLVTLLVAQSRMRSLTTLTGVSAALSLGMSYAAIGPFGAVGAILGVLVGELANVLGIVFLIFRQPRVGGTTQT